MKNKIQLISAVGNEIENSEEYDVIQINNDEEFEGVIYSILDYVDGAGITEYGFDLETTGLDSITEKILLSIFYFGDNCFIFHRLGTSKLITELNNRKITCIGHNLKFDFSMLETNEGHKVIPSICFDTMIAEDRLAQGLKFVSKSLDGLIKTYLKKSISKEQRENFIGVNPDKFIPSKEDIIYCENDVKYLSEIKKNQINHIVNNNLVFLLKDIEFPLISILSKNENNGFLINWTGHSLLLKEKKEQLVEIESKMDEELNKFINDEVKDKNSIRIQYILQRINKPRKVQQTYNNSLNLFGEEQSLRDLLGKKTTRKNYDKEYKIKDDSHKLNYSSNLQLKIVFAILNQPLPIDSSEFGDDDLIGIPVFKNENNVKDYSLNETLYKPYNSAREYKIFSNNAKISTNVKLMEEMLVSIPNIKFKKFIKLLIEYSSTNNLINGFLSNWYSKKYKETGKIHTLWRQAKAVNGRFQSGGGDRMKKRINIQNQPRIKLLRNLFIAGEGKSVSTCDLSGAEVTIMSSKSNDKYLYDIAVVNDDAHSPIAQLAWRNINLYRAALSINYIKSQKEKDSFISNIKHEHYRNQIFDYLYQNSNKESKEYLKLSKELIINRDTNKDYRTAFKNVTFGRVYGNAPKRIAKTLVITLDEAKIAANAVDFMLSKTIKYVKSNAKLALQQGYLIINERTNSRVYFPQVLNSEKYDLEMTSAEKADVSNQARNLPISGTQADMIKEAMVKFEYVIRQNEISHENIHILLQVHDELGVVQLCEYDGVSEQYKNNPKHIYYKNEEFTSPDLLKKIMADTANLYLKPTFKMGAEVQVLPYWTK